MSKRLTDKQFVLIILRSRSGEWVENLYGITHVMVHSRVADLRRDGHQIEMRRFGPGDYRYRLVPPFKPR